MYEFNYHRPATLAEAGKLLADNAEAKLLAGGMTLIPTMKMRLAMPSDLVDLSAIENLQEIADDGDSVRIGAMVRHGLVLNLVGTVWITVYLRWVALPVLGIEP